jgi:hypothetical protein
MTGEYNQGGASEDYSLEQEFAEATDHIIAMLDDSMSEREIDAFIDESFELQHPLIKSYTDSVAKHFLQGEHDESALQAGYRGFHFAMTLSALVLTHEPKLGFTRFSGVLTHSEEQIALSTAELDDFRTSHPTLDRLIGYYMSELDPDGHYAHVAELLALTTFMMIESGERELQMLEAIGDFAIAMASWDGDLDGIL